jgi:hypothetical protein
MVMSILMELAAAIFRAEMKVERVHSSKMFVITYHKLMQLSSGQK